MKGRITKIIANKGFGFLRDEAGVDRFFHARECVTPFEQLRENVAVDLEPYEEAGRGNRARKVQVTA